MDCRAYVTNEKRACHNKSVAKRLCADHLETLTEERSIPVVTNHSQKSMENILTLLQSYEELFNYQKQYYTNTHKMRDDTNTSDKATSLILKCFIDKFQKQIEKYHLIAVLSSNESTCKTMDDLFQKIDNDLMCYHIGLHTLSMQLLCQQDPTLSLPRHHSTYTVSNFIAIEAVKDTPKYTCILANGENSKFILENEEFKIKVQKCNDDHTLKFILESENEVIKLDKLIQEKKKPMSVLTI
jgi:hypothetical protein